MSQKTMRFLFLILFSSFVAHAGETETFLTPDEIALFYKQGYFVKKQALNPKEMECLRIEISMTIDQALKRI